MTRPAADLLKHFWNGTGNTLTIGLGGNVGGFFAIPNALDGQTLSYEIEHENLVEKETGIGAFAFSGTVLSRDLVTQSTVGAPARHPFTAGIKHVRITALALDLIENRATTDPTATDDISKGYIAGRSRWLNATTKKLWFCTNHTAGLAEWVSIPLVQSFASSTQQAGTLTPAVAVTAELNVVAILGDPLTATLTAALPSAIGQLGRQFLFYRTGGGDVDFVAGPGTARKGEQIRLVSDGTAWQLIEDRRPAQVRFTSPSVALTQATYGWRKLTLTAASDLTVLVPDTLPTGMNVIVSVESAAVDRSITFTPQNTTGAATIQAWVNPIVIPKNTPYECFLYVGSNSDGVHAVVQVYDRTGRGPVRETSGTGARTIGQQDVDTQQRNSSGAATWTINPFIGSIFADNIDGGALTLAPGAGVTLSDTVIAAGKFATLVGRNGGASVYVIEAP